MSSNLASHLKNLTGSKITDHKKRKVQKDTTGTIYLSMFISQNLQDFMYNFLDCQKMFNTRLQNIFGSAITEKICR